MENVTVGISGGIGSGKSVVARILRCNGFTVYDCDSQARFLMENHQELINKLKTGIGEEIYDDDGKIKRAKLSKLLFSNDDIRNLINNLVHNAVKKDIEIQRNNIKGWFFIESAILVTSHLASLCNKIWVVTAPKNERIKRISLRNNITEKEIEQRMKSQEEEIKLLSALPVLELKNDNRHPLLPRILKLTEKYINHQTYTISC